MAEPYIARYKVGDLEITSVVLDKDEYDDLCDELGGIIDAATGKRVTESEIRALKNNNHIPMVARGSLTEHIFTKYDIETDRASIIVRGKGAEVAQRSLI